MHDLQLVAHWAAFNTDAKRVFFVQPLASLGDAGTDSTDLVRLASDDSHLGWQESTGLWENASLFKGGPRSGDRIGQNSELTEIGSKFVSFCLVRVVLADTSEKAGKRGL